MARIAIIVGVFRRESISYSIFHRVKIPWHRQNPSPKSYLAKGAPQLLHSGNI